MGRAMSGKRGKVFAIAGWNEGDVLAITFKCSPLSFDL
jgi:predicted DNA-binding protein (MmcQ/YjbR family)